MGVKVAILCGGEGTRLKEETEYKPKPLVTIGHMPILWHIMKIYSHYGFNDFVLCLGYKGDMIKEFFLNYEWMANDFTMNLKSRNQWVTHLDYPRENWTITFADTGRQTLTAERLLTAKKYLEDGDYFLATYGDGLADVNLKELTKFHQKTKKIATLTGMHPSSKYGQVQFSKDKIITKFAEKPVLSDYINGGYFVFQPALFDHLKKGEMLESSLQRLVGIKQLSLFEHNGFWQGMDTYKDYQDLNNRWNSRDVPWKIWED